MASLEIDLVPGMGLADRIRRDVSSVEALARAGLADYLLDEGVELPYPFPDSQQDSFGVTRVPIVNGDEIVSLPALVRRSVGSFSSAYYLATNDTVILYSEKYRRTKPGGEQHLADMANGVGWVLLSLKRHLGQQIE